MEALPTQTKMDQPIRINKTLAALLIIAGVIFLLISLGRTVLMNYTYDSGASLSVISAISGPIQFGVLFFGYAVQLGLLWVLFTFKENGFVKSGVIVEMVAGVFMIAFTMMIPTLAARNAWSFQYIGMMLGVFNLVITLYLAITFFCVQNPLIKTLFIFYGVVLIMVNAFVYSLSFMEKMGVHVSMQLVNYLTLIPLIMPIVVFIHVYRLASAQANINPYLQKPDAPFTFDQEKQP